jgi:hypothetical protein
MRFYNRCQQPTRSQQLLHHRSSMSTKRDQDAGIRSRGLTVGWCARPLTYPSMGRPPNRSIPIPLTLSLPAETHEYLVLLASMGKLGVLETEIAAHLVVEEVRRLEREKFHERRLPKPVPK